jgi:hypothetical protein
MGQVPFAGMAWQVLHHLEGFRRLGHDVFYVEDTGSWSFDPVQNRVSANSSYAVQFIERMLNWCGLPGRWAYRSAPENGRVFGLSDSDLAGLYSRADILINLTGATRLRGKQLDVPVRIFLETDPVLPEIEVAKGNAHTLNLLGAHSHHFTYGENIGEPTCGVPTGPFNYRPTRPPVIVEWWQTSREPRECFTTIGNWKQSGKDIEWNGELLTWSKHHAFLRFLPMPQRVSQCVELALSSVDADAIDALKSSGWRVRDAVPLSLDIAPYRDYVQLSRGEFTVAKDQNARLKSGWFSDRSACYLAAGRPVITQNTGFETTLPVGEGLFSFETMDDIVSAFEAVSSDYDRHSRAASALARDCFRAETVLAKLLSDIGVKSPESRKL